MLGANLSAEKASFRVWAPHARQVVVRVRGEGEHALVPGEGGVWETTLPAQAGDRYFYVVEGSKPVPDPVSRSLPEGVHGPTEIVDPSAFRWNDEGWKGIPRDDLIIYELHVGTFTPEGTFDSAIEKLKYLKQTLGVTAVEVMPVSSFPGRRNWGYDGVSPYSVQHTYGGPDAFKRFIDAAHRLGLAVLLDVVYNHLGNEGNYLRLFGPYFTDRHKTPWGEAINYDGDGNEGVRRYVVENALFWIREYRLDGLRLDAIQTIYDDSRRHIVAEIQQHVQQLARTLGRTALVIAETDENKAFMVKPVTSGGWGLDGVWSDDFHHSLHALLTGESAGYYQDFGQPQQVARALEEGFVFQGEHFQYWNAPRGSKPKGVPLPAHVICIQNHDQVGNRARGGRLTKLVPRGARKMAAALLLLAPHTPLLFMGQEYSEPAPFQFFTSYGDPALQEAVREGRRREFKEFAWEDVPDPEDPATFERSRLHWEFATPENEMLNWYRALLDLRRKHIMGKERTCRARVREGVLVLEAPRNVPKLMVLAALSQGVAAPPAGKGWRKVLESVDDEYVVEVHEWAG